jgi:hypothetical protein
MVKEGRDEAVMMALNQTSMSRRDQENSTEYCVGKETRARLWGIPASGAEDATVGLASS